MKRKLLTQIANEWRNNIWLALELLIVSVVLWYIADVMFCKLAIYNQPLGFEYDHCYEIQFSQLDPKSPDYVAYDSEEEKNRDINTLLQRLEARPEVEAVGAGLNAIMYNGNNNGSYLIIDTLKTGYRWIVQRLVTPDFARVFRYRGANGETPEEIAQIMSEDPYAFLATNDILSEAGISDLRPFIGRSFESKSNGPDNIVLKGILQPIRYSDFYPAYSSQSVLQPLPQGALTYVNEIVIRVKDNMDKDIETNIMKDASTRLKIGNFYVTGVKSISDRRAMFNRNDNRQLTYHIIGAIFLSINVFLGLLGTFWFRTQQREHEIAIRRVNGATRNDIFRRTITEGLIILTIVTPIALIIDYALAANELNSYYESGYFEPGRFFITGGAVYALMLIVILLGAFIPARKAVNVQPAIALSEN